MSARLESQSPVSDHSYHAAGLFAKLTIALDRNDFAEAASAHKKLDQLGYFVHVRFPAASAGANGNLPKNAEAAPCA